MSRWLSPASRVGTRRMTLSAHSSSPCQSPATTIRHGPPGARDPSPADSDSDGSASDGSDSDPEDSDPGDPAPGASLRPATAVMTDL